MNLLIACVPDAVRLDLRKYSETLDFSLLEPANAEAAAAMLERPGSRVTVFLDADGWNTTGRRFFEDLRNRTAAPVSHCIVLIGGEGFDFAPDEFAIVAETVDFLARPLDVGDLARRLQLARQVLHLRERLLPSILPPPGNPTAAPVLTEASFFPLMDREIQRAERYLRPLSFMVIHLDQLRETAAAHGEGAARAVVRAAGERCSHGLRAEDCVGCIRETSLAALLPETGAPGAAQCAERLRGDFEANPLQTDAGRTFAVTLSLGVATLGCETATLDELMAAALAASEESRADGGNAVSVAATRGALEI